MLMRRADCILTGRNEISVSNCREIHLPKGGTNKMSQQQASAAAPVKKTGYPIDTWAVLLAFVLAALVRAGVFKHIPW